MNKSLTIASLCNAAASHPSITFLRLPASPPSPPASSVLGNCFAFVKTTNAPNVAAALAQISHSTAIKALVIDLFYTSAVEAASSLRIPVHYFFTSGAAVLALCCHLSALHRQTTSSFRDMAVLVLFTPLPTHADFVGSACLKVSPTKVIDSLTQVIALIQQLASILSRFTSRFADFRLATAVSDCLDLLDLSSEVLSWSLAAAQGKHNGTGNLSSDLRTCLSVALAHPGNRDPSTSTRYLRTTFKFQRYLGTF